MASGNLMGSVVEMRSEFKALAASAQVTLDVLAEVQKLIYNHLMEYTQNQLLVLTEACSKVGIHYKMFVVQSRPYIKHLIICAWKRYMSGLDQHS